MRGVKRVGRQTSTPSRFGEWIDALGIQGDEELVEELPQQGAIEAACGKVNHNTVRLLGQIMKNSKPKRESTMHSYFKKVTKDKGGAS